ncbi:hypothetical protein ABID08_006150 [Rhizobium binae]|uniref:Polysaccharide pyruvyl transferase domain-containing protein n=1 Tax=Rhizobium binae TaxID=1138190 RepID=A0ABV2MQM2_9HYPH|nr:polysaccharide pyruvyl transferase family protein [Rhizobium binae]MBX4994142.1 polysaccharide pyruvyl transferase family protein [Rhizobium binae]NKL51775.1 hypothetical protein [Rhizobium leguminosarum bv. viciae]QSY82995.1 polysaccharide pyruvyl transferase family protein [Rhizobium binae]
MVAVLSPFLVPPSIRHQKKVNYGDGFILRAIERQVGRFSPSATFSPRVPLGDYDFAQLQLHRYVILAGANQLKDDFAPIAKMKASTLRKSNLVFIPFGIGLHGEAGFNEGFTENAREILSIMHERIEYSSWRCPLTTGLLNTALPALREQALMTCCPVVMDRPLLDGSRFERNLSTIAVTITDRGDFWDRETPILKEVAELFPNKRRVLVFHQDFDPPSAFEPLADRLTIPLGSQKIKTSRHVRRLARQLGYEILIANDVDTLLAFYEHVDLHVGSRLHAHLHMLSQNKWSFLIKVDERSTGIASALGFELINAGQLNRHLDTDLEVVRTSAQACKLVMQRFVDAIPGRP